MTVHVTPHFLPHRCALREKGVLKIILDKDRTIHLYQDCFAPDGVRFMTVNPMGWAMGLEGRAIVAWTFRVRCFTPGPSEGQADRAGKRGRYAACPALPSMGNPVTPSTSLRSDVPGVKRLWMCFGGKSPFQRGET